MKNKIHTEKEIAQAATLFFMVRGIVRQHLSGGRKLNPYAWLHIETLVFIRDHQGPSMRAIADHLSITAPSATSLVAALARSGLVTRKANTKDKRALHIYLTKKGEALLADTVERGMQVLGDLFSVLSKEELAGFTRALARIKVGAGK